MYGITFNQFVKLLKLVFPVEASLVCIIEVKFYPVPASQHHVLRHTAASMGLNPIVVHLLPHRHLQLAWHIYKHTCLVTVSVFDEAMMNREEITHLNSLLLLLWLQLV